MNVIILAAGRGSRLAGADGEFPPKSLIEIGGKTLLQRHLDILHGLGFSGVRIVVGYRHGDIADELERIEPEITVSTVYNDDYLKGSILSLRLGLEAVEFDEPLFLMDADVLYPGEIIARILKSEHENCLPVDRSLDASDGEAVKIACKKERIADFGKEISAPHEFLGEWPGFAKFSGASANRLREIADRTISRGGSDRPYEPVIRELILENGGTAFKAVDITGIPWIEIDFPEDLEKAKNEILPRVAAFTGEG